MTSAPEVLTKPLAGVIATNPATAPAAAPSTEGCPCLFQLKVVQVRAPIAAAVCVTTKALTAKPLLPIALPALNPNHPNHSNPAPSTTIGTSWASISSLPNPTRLPTTKAQTRAAIPEEIWTTVPPAKSRAPIVRIQPPTPQTQ